MDFSGKIQTANGMIVKELNILGSYAYDWNEVKVNDKYESCVCRTLRPFQFMTAKVDKQRSRSLTIVDKNLIYSGIMGHSIEMKRNGTFISYLLLYIVQRNIEKCCSRIMRFYLFYLFQFNCQFLGLLWMVLMMMMMSDVAFGMHAITAAIDKE